MSENLKLLISQETKPRVERRIYIQLPNEIDHQDHVINEVLYHLSFFVKSVGVLPPPPQIPPFPMYKSQPIKNLKFIFLVVLAI